ELPLVEVHEVTQTRLDGSQRAAAERDAGRLGVAGKARVEKLFGARTRRRPAAGIADDGYVGGILEYGRRQAPALHAKTRGRRNQRGRIRCREESLEKMKAGVGAANGRLHLPGRQIE